MINNISKIKYHKGNLLVEFTDREVIQGSEALIFDARTLKKFEKPPHPDFLKSWEQLSFHLAAINEFIDENQAKTMFKSKGIVKWAENEGFTVITLHVKGEDDKEGFQLTGMKKLSSGKVTPAFNTPFLKWDDEQYVMNGELNELVETIKKEVVSYISDGKCAPIEQLELFAKNGHSGAYGGEEEEYEDDEKVVKMGKTG